MQDYITDILEVLGSAEVVQGLQIAASATIVLGFGAVLLRLFNAVLDYRRLRRLEQKLTAANNAPAFTKEEIRRAIRDYIRPDCAPTDPSNESDLRQVVDIREPVISAVRRFVRDGTERRHLLVLADSGMGKTTFCLNFFAQAESDYRRGKQQWRAAIISLSRDKAVEAIQAIQDKNQTVLLLDAFDEDAAAIRDGAARMREILAAASEFLCVIVTCRSQFFKNDASIPTETGVAVIRPRRAGEGHEYKLFKLYLLPFTRQQVRQYVRKQFPVWNLAAIFARRDAERLVRDIPELSVRPMLLALIPDLTKADVRIQELFGLYEFMVGKWLERESRWINPSVLLRISEKLAVQMYAVRGPGKGDRATPDELYRVAETVSPAPADWEHLTTRSLLNRDSEGRYKFAHRSILEFLFVRAAIAGDDRCFRVKWTDLMKELFISWGRANNSSHDIDIARSILQRDLRKTGILPLENPLPLPRQRRVGVLGSLERVRPRSKIAVSWRADSIRVLKVNSAWEVFDLAHGLTWRVVSRSSLAPGDEIDPYLLGPGELHRIDATLRLPSAEEFCSLVEAQWLSNVELLDDTQLYWLADQTGYLERLLASLRRVPDDIAYLTPADLKDVRTEGVYFSIFSMVPKQFGGTEKFRAMAAYVVVGDTEQAWHMASAPKKRRGRAPGNAHQSSS